MADPIRQILSEVAALLQPTNFDPATAEFTVSLAATDYALRAVVLPSLPRLRAQAPGVRVAITLVGSENFQARFERSELDLALVTPETPPQDLHSRHLFEEPYVCALRCNHPDLSGRSLSIDRFASSTTHWSPTPGSGFAV